MKKDRLRILMAVLLLVFTTSCVLTVSAETPTIQSVTSVQQADDTFLVTVPVSGITGDATILVFDDSLNDGEEIIGSAEIKYADQKPATDGASQFQFYVPYALSGYTLRAGGTGLSATSQDLTFTINSKPSVSGDATINYVEMTAYESLAVYSATDSEGDAVTLSLGGSDAAYFEISQDGKLKFKDGALKDFDTSEPPKNSYSITVIATETKEGGFQSEPYAVTVNVLDAAYTLKAVSTNLNFNASAEDTYADIDLPSTVTVSYTYTYGESGAGEAQADIAVTWPAEYTLVSGDNVFAADISGASILGEAFDPGTVTVNANVYKLGGTGTPEAPLAEGSFSTSYDSANQMFIITYKPTNADSKSTILVFDDSMGDGNSVGKINPLEIKYADQIDNVTTGSAVTFAILQTQPGDEPTYYARIGGTGLSAYTQLLTLRENGAPQFTTPQTEVSFNENTDTSAVIATYAATDPDGDAVTLSLEGTDASFFALSADGKLTPAAVYDFEAAGAKKSFSIKISASDTEGAKTTIDVAVTLTDVYYTVTSVTNPAKGSDVIFGTSFDSITKPETVSVTYEGGTEPYNAPVTWTAPSSMELGEVSVTGSLGLINGENIVLATGISQPEWKFNVIEAIAAPVFTTGNEDINKAAVSFKENNGANDVIATYEATVPGSQAFTYSLENNYSGLFSIAADGKLAVTQALDYDTAAVKTWAVKVIATNNADASKVSSLETTVTLENVFYTLESHDNNADPENTLSTYYDSFFKTATVGTAFSELGLPATVAGKLAEIEDTVQIPVTWQSGTVASGDNTITGSLVRAYNGEEIIVPGGVSAEAKIIVGTELTKITHTVYFIADTEKYDVVYVRVADTIDLANKRVSVALYNSAGNLTGITTETLDEEGLASKGKVEVIKEEHYTIIGFLLNDSECTDAVSAKAFIWDGLKSVAPDSKVSSIVWDQADLK